LGAEQHQQRRPRSEQLRITEVFHSIQGESRAIGLPTVFVRLTGCPLRCRWCDTPYAFTGGSLRTIDAILEEIRAFATPAVCVTGGEPLAQPGCRRLLSALCEEGFRVSLETSGALDIAGIDPRVAIVMDLKAPGSGEEGRNRWENLAHLRPADELKIVVADRTDYEWARAVVRERGLADICPVAFSPAWQVLEARELAEWILADRLPVSLQVQLHKYLWGDAPGH
jgi:7-carboxy-7-deazaguanine synthase